jgi:hypothetical protein
MLLKQWHCFAGYSCVVMVGAVCLQVRLGVVAPGNADVIRSVRSLEAYTVSWSNVPDYIPPADFHKLARSISAPEDTVHFMHRWVRRTNPWDVSKHVGGKCMASACYSYRSSSYVIEPFDRCDNVHMRIEAECGAESGARRR